MIKHRVLSPDSFVSKFTGNEDLLRGFAELWPDGLDLDVGSLTVAAFRRFGRQFGSQDCHFDLRAKRVSVASIFYTWTVAPAT